MHVAGNPVVKVAVRRVSAAVLFLLLGAAGVCTAGAQEPVRKPHPGPGPNGDVETVFSVHRLGSDHTEGITSIDMNGDGFADLLSGSYWYENPGANGGEWTRHQFRTVEYVGEFVSDSGEWAIDVNHDGAPDVVTTGWMTNGVWWYENPKKPGVMWQKHFITDSYDTEGGALADINGDGKPDVALAHYNHSGLLWIDFSGPQPKVHHVGGKEQDGHGVGVADIDGDGKPDLLTPFGWFRNIDADKDQWEWHADWNLGDAGFPILGYDVNNDGKMDLIYGQGHGYGLYWLEQTGSGADRRWVKHVIDESFSQSHAIKLADIDGDGEPELITGKRYRGHNGKDPGSYDPLVVYYYKIDRKTATFRRYTISVNGTAGVGTQILAEDFDHDGDIDLATAGKTGVHFFENLKINNVPKETREQQILLEKKWPFPDEGSEAKWVNGPKPQ
jgi:hypothetical protein